MPHPVRQPNLNTPFISQESSDEEEESDEDDSDEDEESEDIPAAAAVGPQVSSSESSCESDEESLVGDKPLPGVYEESDEINLEAAVRRLELASSASQNREP